MIYQPGKNWWVGLRIAIALVWIYQGLWLKLIAVEPRHLEIVAAVPFFVSPRVSLGLIGLLELLFGLSVFLRWKPKLSVYAQIGFLAFMNAGGILFAASSIPDVGGMVTMNLVFILSIWGQAHCEDRK